MDTISRRQFLHRSSVAIAATAMANFGYAKPKKMPNVVILLADQLRSFSCGYFGDKQAFTPNLDRLSREGANYRQAVSSMPVCSAYRASLFTGKYTTSTGMVINELRMNTNHRCIGHVVTDAGYNTGYIGKWHLYANVLGDHFNPDNSFVPRGPDRLGWDGYWAAYNFHHEYYGENSYYHTESREKIHYGEGVFEPDAQTNMAIDYMKKNYKSDKPFFLTVSYGTPHDPWNRNNVPEAYYEMYKDEVFEPAGNFSDKLDPYGDNWSNWPDLTPEAVQRCKRIYYAMTANFDWNMGRFMKALNELGIAEDTIVLISCDHGEMFGGHGRMKKNIFYDEAARIPFLLLWKGKIKPVTTDVCMNTVDIMPTILDLCGLGSEIPKEVEGVSLANAAFGKKCPNEPEVAFLMNTGACAAWENGHEWRAVRNKKFTYAVFKGGGPRNLPRKEMLFSNEKDPLQMDNLVADEAYKGVKEHLSDLMKKKMEELNDGFASCNWYRDNWTQDRIIMETAKGKFPTA